MSNIARLLESRLPDAIVFLLRSAGEVSRQLGIDLYLVGGVVRDIHLSNVKTIDIDLSAVGATPEYAAALAESLGGRITQVSQFGTYRLIVGDTTIDLVTARKESYARPGALPDVTPSNIRDDLARRDFTMSAMAISLSPDSWGELLDPLGGLADIESKTIRVIHDRSFVEDATRIFRAIRYAIRLGFSLDDSTKAHLLSGLSYIDAISGERLLHEFQRIFQEARAVDMLITTRDLGILSAVHAGLNPTDQVFEKLRAGGTDQVSPDEAIFAIALTWGLAASDREALISRLNMPAAWAIPIREVEQLRRMSGEIGSPLVSRSVLFEKLHGFDLAAIRACAVLTDDAAFSSALDLYLNDLRHVRPELNGDDLITLGILQGPMVGSLLRELRRERLDGTLSSEDDEREYVARALKGSD